MSGGTARADYALKLTEGVTSIRREAYRLHMPALWVCVVIAIPVCGAMAWSMYFHRKSRGAVAAKFHDKARVEIAWTVLPFLVLVGLAIPATTALILTATEVRRVLQSPPFRRSMNRVRKKTAARIVTTAARRAHAPSIIPPRGERPMKRTRTVALVAAAVLAITACATHEQAGQPAGKSAQPRLSQLPPVVSPEANPTTPDKVALGAKLWIDKRLSGSGNMACTTCHVRPKGWTDGETLSRKDNGDFNTRHSPTMYNVGYSTNFYWDGRAATLEGQVLAAWRLQIYGDPAKVAANLAAVPGYAAEFQKVFAAPPTQDTIVKALAAYLRAKVSGDSPWDRHEKGQANAVSEDAKAGFLLFMGKGRCAVCHTPPVYSDFNFHNVGLEAGRAKPDIGRGNVTKKPEDMSAFKTPTLRSVAISAPYFHDGSRKTLDDAVRFMANGGGNDPNKSAQITDTKLTDPEIKQIVAFLTSLTSDEPYTAPKLP